MHAEINVEGSVLMLCDAEAPFAPPGAAGTPVALHVYVGDVDGVTGHAVGAGAELLQPPTDMLYGARQAMLRDPFGHVWIFLTLQQDLSPEEIVRRWQQVADSTG